jgi:hypothetical protein
MIVGAASGGVGSGKRTISPEYRIVNSVGTYSAGGVNGHRILALAQIP